MRKVPVSGQICRKCLILCGTSHCSDHAGFQAPFSDPQIAMQAVHDIGERALVVELPALYSALENRRTGGISNRYLACPVSVGRCDIDLVRRQRFAEQQADMFHTDHHHWSVKIK